MRSIGGEWRGFYDDPRFDRANAVSAADLHRFPISARLDQNGTRLEGTMVDEETNTDVLVSDQLRRTAQWLSRTDRDYIEDFAARYPELRAQYVLGKHSTLSGRIEGSQVAFRKRYLKPQTVIWDFGNGRVSTAIRKVAVDYRGTLSEDGRMIAGTWQIAWKTFFGLCRRVHAEGTFRLERQG